MTLNLGSPWLSLFSHPSPSLPKVSETFPNNNSTSIFPLLLCPTNSLTFASFSKALKTRASLSESESGVSVDSFVSQLLDGDLLAKVSGAKDATEALEIIADKSGRSGGVVEVNDCRLIVSAALERNNAELALSVFYAMRASFDNGTDETTPFVERWRWTRPDVHVYTSLVQGLAVSLRVSDALRIIEDICQVGVSPGEEVPFGKVVRCPSCTIAVAVAQPQHGIQVETPSGMARTHRFATETVDLPAQQGERVTIAVAAPSNLYREVGPFKFSPKAPNFYPGEPLYLTNHKDGRDSPLLRAPLKEGSSSLLNPSILFPLLAVLATGDAASGIIDPSLPQFLSTAAVASLAVGATLNAFVFPQLNQLPQRSVDAIAIKQQLLSQYDVLQTRIKGLREAAEKEVWMLARMCQLENKISAVGEPSYRARKSRVKRVREGLENSLTGLIELIDSFARISSMIEIEVELDSDVLAAEAASNAESIAEQIQQIMELENLEERWRLQAEANDEAERLLSQPAEQI
ncbi:uncharacterized protein LOC121234595 isoform X2 [Juglans microcarpa x Juglans regia]|uniref:uncharacterized protein LOC121234595 isoform X2 n=1 Tax=Juglans microcarpa x Juglans regia TaxID=2249226 RepID=UPI001B7E2AD1|nr:uncharacterized protein LOC121234595 isoform X2 [Juglans microcarpa x Juglans regia]